MLRVQFQRPIQRGHHSPEPEHGGEALAVDAYLLAETAEEGEVCVGKLIVRGHGPFRERLALLKVGQAHGARLRRPAKVAFLLRCRAQLRGRILRRCDAGNDAQENQRDTGKDRLGFHARTLPYSPPDVLGTALSASANASA